MRRMFLIAVASCTLLAVAPATALARHHSRRGHHARVHHKKFGTDPASPNTPSGTMTPVNTAPSTTMSVVSFAGGVLTISDSTGQNIMGTVTADTRLICIAPQQPPNTSPTNTAPTGTWQGHDHGGWGGDNGGWGGDNGGGDQGGDGFGHHHHHGDDQGQGDDEGQNQMCTTADLVAGTPVQFADLSLSSTGTQWDTVVLQVAPSTVPTVPDTDNDGN